MELGTFPRQGVNCIRGKSQDALGSPCMGSTGCVVQLVLPSRGAYDQAEPSDYSSSVSANKYIRQLRGFAMLVVCCGFASCAQVAQLCRRPSDSSVGRSTIDQS